MSCIGLIFKYKTSTYLSKKGHFVIKQSMNLLKRKSCKCYTCLTLLDCFQNDYLDFAIIIPLCACDNELFSLKVINESTDWETGLVDDWEYEFYATGD